jgi:hypothetical protein
MLVYMAAKMIAVGVLKEQAHGHIEKLSPMMCSDGITAVNVRLPT